MDREAWFRRAVHLAFPAFLAYYLIPVEDWTDVRREAVLIAVFAGFLAFEIGRRRARFRLFGMRDYEVAGVPAYMWAGAGLAVSLLLFPLEAVVPTVFGVAIVDPLCGFMRDRRSPFYPSLPWAVWALVTLLALARLTPWTFLPALGAAAATAAVAVAVERPTIKNVDDDFLMLVVPGITLTALLTVIP